MSQVSSIQFHIELAYLSLAPELNLTIVFGYLEEICIFFVRIYPNLNSESRRV